MQGLHPRTPNVTQDAQTMARIVDEFFPTHAPREPDEEVEIGEISKISEAELKLAADSLKSGKLPGPDGIPAEALKAAVQTCPQLLLDVCNGCFKQGRKAESYLKKSSDLDYRAQSRLPGAFLTDSTASDQGS